MVGFATIILGAPEDSSTPRGIVANMLEVVQNFRNAQNSFINEIQGVQAIQKTGIYQDL
jgi:hypothetical protein